MRVKHGKLYYRDSCSRSSGWSLLLSLQPVHKIEMLHLFGAFGEMAKPTRTSLKRNNFHPLLEICVAVVVIAVNITQNESVQTTEWSRKIAQSLMHHHFATVCSRLTWFSPECSVTISVYQSMQILFQLIKICLINSRNSIHVMSDVTLHVNMTPLTVEDRLLIKTSQTEKGWTVEKMIIEFPARQWKWHMLFDLLRIIESTGFAKRLSGRDRCRSEWTDSNIKLIKT